MSLENVSHADIYRALGVLEGKLDAVHQSLNQRNRDFETALKRIADLEKVVAKGLGVALTCSFVLPMLIGVAGWFMGSLPHPRAQGFNGSQGPQPPAQQQHYRP